MYSVNKKGNIVLWVVFLVVIIGMIVAAVIYGDKQTEEVNPVASEEQQEILTVKSDDNIRGAEDPSVVIVEYSDFQCPACASMSTVIEEIVNTNPGEVQFVYRHLPLRTIHPNADLAARAAEAAGNQGKFFEMHDILFEKQSEWSGKSNPRNTFTEYAESLSLDLDIFANDLNSSEARSKVNKGYQEAVTILGGERFLTTPTIVINQEVVPSGSLGRIEQLVKEAIEETSREETTDTEKEEGQLEE